MAIHRFKCSTEMNQAIIHFADMHKFDDSDLLDTQFQTWINTPTIQKIVEEEKNYLARHHYETDIEVKIFKSIKYYYIKKILKTKETDKDKDKDKDKESEKKPRKHHTLPKELKASIQLDLEKRFAETPLFKPSDTFALFDISAYDLPEMTIKKCYKNQYYQMKHKKYVSSVDA
jgi:hypothetical protein